MNNAIQLVTIIWAAVGKGATKAIAPGPAPAKRVPKKDSSMGAEKKSTTILTVKIDEDQKHFFLQKSSSSKCTNCCCIRTRGSFFRN